MKGSEKMNIAELKVEMIRNNFDRKKMSKLLDLTPSSITKKLKGENDFTRKDINKIIKAFNLTPERTQEIFFAS